MHESVHGRQREGLWEIDWAIGLRGTGWGWGRLGEEANQGQGQPGEKSGVVGQPALLPGGTPGGTPS